MIRHISGKLISKSVSSAIVETGGIGFLLYMSNGSLASLPSESRNVSLHAYLHVKEDALELYGFLTAEELAFFELLIGISGVGPRSALAVLDVGSLDSLKAAIAENRPDLMTRATGIGKKTAERIILELKNKIDSGGGEGVVRRIDDDSDLLEALLGLGYRAEEARAAISKIDPDISDLEDRFKAVMAILKK